MSIRTFVFMAVVISCFALALAISRAIYLQRAPQDRTTVPSRVSLFVRSQREPGHVWYARF
jgi:hypothetical protein